MTLALQLLTHNDARFVPHLLTSLRAQTDRDWILWWRDQSTHDAERAQIAAIRLSCADLPIRCEEGENLGFAGGHARLFCAQDAELVLLVNTDTILTPTYIERLRAAFTDPRLGSASGLIRRFSLADDGVPVRSETIDSAGLLVRPWGKVIDRRDEPKEARDVFGVSGCLPMVSRAAVCASTSNGSLFDPAYHSYKEDVDLAYRLARGGFTSRVIPDAVAYHHRSVRRGRRFARSSYQVFNSYRNHLWNLNTHKQWTLLTVLYEAGKAAFMLATHPVLCYRAWKETVHRSPSPTI